MREKTVVRLLVLLAGAGLVAVAVAAASAPVPVKATTRNENTPSASAEYLAWSKSRRGKPTTFDVYAQPTGGAPFKVNAPGTVGWAGGIDGTRLAYQQVWKKNSDIRFFDLLARRRSSPSGVNTSGSVVGSMNGSSGTFRATTYGYCARISGSICAPSPAGK